MRLLLSATVLIVICGLLESASANELPVDPGSKMVSGGVDMIMYGEEFAEMIVATLIYGLIVGFTDTTAVYEPFDDDWRDANDIDIRISSVQVGTGLGYFVAPGVAVGGRVLWQGDTGGMKRRALAGVGPEVTCFIRRNGKSWMPYFGAAAVYTGSPGLKTAGRRKGTLMLLKGGISSNTTTFGGAFVQISYQRDNLVDLDGSSIARSRFGVGLGLNMFFD